MQQQTDGLAEVLDGLGDGLTAREALAAEVLDVLAWADSGGLSLSEAAGAETVASLTLAPEVVEVLVGLPQVREAGLTGAEVEALGRVVAAVVLVLREVADDVAEVPCVECGALVRVWGDGSAERCACGADPVARDV